MSLAYSVAACRTWLDDLLALGLRVRCIPTMRVKESGFTAVKSTDTKIIYKSSDAARGKLPGGGNGKKAATKKPAAKKASKKPMTPKKATKKKATTKKATANRVTKSVTLRSENPLVQKVRENLGQWP